MHGNNVCVIYGNVSVFTLLGNISVFVLYNGDFRAIRFLTFRFMCMLTDALDTYHESLGTGTYCYSLLNLEACSEFAVLVASVLTHIGQ
jgi:hypothetical protein